MYLTSKKVNIFAWKNMRIKTAIQLIEKKVKKKYNHTI